MILGFPGETNEEFEELLNFVKETKFNKLGAFTYSKEDGTPAEKLPNQIHGNTKKSRYNKIMQTQQEISKENLEKKKGKKYDVIIEDMSFDKNYFVGRTMQDVPEIDGIVYIKNENQKEDMLNKFAKCEVTDVENYDLIAKFAK